MIIFDREATVRGLNRTTGRLNDVLREGLKVRLSTLRAANAGNSTEDRRLLLTMRRLMWQPDYVMPEGAQIEIDGVKWQPSAGTFATIRGPAGVAVFKVCDVTRVDAAQPV